MTSDASNISRISEPKLSVRLVSADSYQCTPIPMLDPSYSEFRGSEIKQVPVIRIFGTTTKGEKVCLHIHGVFPYIYIPCTNNEMDNFVYHLATALDSAINITLASTRANTQHVFKIQSVTGIPFYGYHKKKHKFYKIYFYNPAMVKKATELLQNGSIMNQVFQTHEAHIPFILQFMMDYNIYGMSFVDLKEVFYRRETQPLSGEMFFDDCTPPPDEKKYMPNSVTKQSTCGLEVDATAQDIINRLAIENGVDINPGIAAIWEEEKLRRSLAGMPTDDCDMVCPLTCERNIELPPTDNDVYQKERYVKRLLRITQNSVSETSSIQSNESYPAAVDEEDDLANASNVENHLSGHDETLNESVQQNQLSQVSDMSLLEILEHLAEESENPQIVDEDSILGSQKTIIQSEEESETEEDDEIPDLNLTNWEIDPFAEGPNENPNSPVENIPSQMFEDDFSVPEPRKKSDFNIPAFDGPCDSSDSEQEADFTLECVEKRVCAYNPADDINTTPKRKRPDCATVGSTSKKRKIQSIHKTPIRSPRTRFLNSPSSSRNYSPLKIEIVTSPRVRRESPVQVHEPQIDLEKKRKELEVLRSIHKKVQVRPDLEDDEVLAEDSDDSQRGDSNSPIVTRQKYKNSNRSVARKLQFSKGLSQKKHLPAEEDLDVVSESSADLSEIEDIRLECSSNQQSSFSTMLSISKSLDNFQSIRPRFNPPSRDRIESTMETYDIPKCRYQEPFYNNEEDVDGQKEMAHKILKVSTKGISSLPQFVSSLEDVYGIDHWRNAKVQIFESSQIFDTEKQKQKADKKSFAGHTSVRITPLIEPPSRKRVETWLKAKEYLQRKKQKESKKEKGKVPNLDKISIVLDSDEDKTICESPSSNEDTLIEEEGSSNFENLIVESLKPAEEPSPAESSSIDSSVKQLLDNTKLMRSAATSNHFGVSCGQIEFLSDSTRDNIEAENLHSKTLAKNQFITIMCVEVHIDTRQDFVPDPQKDAIKALFYSIQNDVPPTSPIKALDYGVIVLDENAGYVPKNYVNLRYVSSEAQMIDELISLVVKYDPEILVGWELENLSWGYLFQRAAILNLNFSSRISRIPKVKYSWEPKALDFEELADFKLPGRIVLEIWKTMRHEIALNSYTFENMMYHVMNERVPFYSYKTLTEFWQSPSHRSRCKVIDYYVKRVIGILRILEQLDIIGRTSEFARLYGVQFYEVFSRGSQFRVESMMLRLAKPLNYIAVSPSNNQRASMRAPEALPLIMEPESSFYSDPLVVLDFQSLYPSIIIAYNYCFSTCLGRVEHIGQSQPFVFGCTTLKVTSKTASELEDSVNFSPCGVAFVKPEVRRGVLPQMLTEILNCRLMVKKSIKDHPSSDKTLQRSLHSRQLGLKLIANVTYGYTAANFSGRMPCIEVGDSVVSKGKETLERAIRIVESTPKWGARVIYGDTDSLFILLKGKTREDAFKIGQEMADVVTQANPPPVKLKFEKVLQPSILQTKKRYCGYMYESLKDEKPVYLAKGIETVRRDGCPAVSKILTKSLKILFETKDVSLIKEYVTRQFDKILQGKVSIEDLTFAREFRGLRGYKPTACVPALELTRRLMKHDPRAVPRNHERVRYVVVAGAPSEALIRCVKSPMEVIKDPGLRLNAIYYITRVIIPPLNRCLNLIGADANLWFNKMPHRLGQRCLEKAVAHSEDKQKITISQYFDNAMCAACGKQTSNKGICEDCTKRPGETIVVLTEKIRQMERVNQLINQLCYSCLGQAESIKCESLDCPVFYRRSQSIAEFSRTSDVHKFINNTFSYDF